MMQDTERAPLEHAHRDPGDPRGSLLYPLMLIAAIAVIVFSIVGIASLIGVMPRALSNSQTVAPEGRSPPASRSELPRKTMPATGERRTGVIESIHVVQTKLPVSGLRASGGVPGAEAAAGGTRPPLIAGPAFSGHEFSNRHVTYRVRVRMDDDGRLRTFYETVRPVYGVGQQVLVTERTIHTAG
jgi:hypothetical protein